MQLPILNVQMFGCMAISYGDRPVLFYKNPKTTTARLAALLLFHGVEGVGRNQLMKELYGDRELADASNNLRVTAYRLKKALVKAGLPDYDYIQVNEGVYYWSSPMETVVDAIRFRELMEEADRELNLSTKSDLFKKALEIYKGDLLQELSEEDWVLAEAARYKAYYTKALSKTCQYLKDCGQFQEVLQLCEPACQMYPFDEWQAVKIDCYSALGRYEEALNEYENAAKVFFEELGMGPSDAIIRRLKDLSTRMHNRYRMLEEMKEQLREPGQEAGAFYCSYPSFRDEYRLLSRVMERTGHPIYLMLCTIMDRAGKPQEREEKLNLMVEPLRHAIKNSLRRCDSFTRCGPGQFLILLAGSTGENCRIACGRIGELFAREHKSWETLLDWNISPAIDL